MARVRDTKTGRIVEKNIGFLSLYTKQKPDLYINAFGLIEKYRRLKFGNDIIKYCINYANRNHYKTISSRVRVSNFPSLLVHLKNGFVIKRLVKKYYSHPVEDALFLKYDTRNSRKTTS